MKKWSYLVILVVVMTWGLAGTAFGADFTIRVGVGQGIPYGASGGNLEFGLINNLAVTGGLGIAPTGLGYCIGGRFYFAGTDQELRPRVGVYYGTIGFISDSSDSWELDGIAFGAGVEWRVKNLGLDFELMLPYDGRYGVQTKVSFGVGYYLTNEWLQSPIGSH